MKLQYVNLVQIILSMDDHMRPQLEEQMTLRRDLFLKALAPKGVKILPRLIDKDKTIKCEHCQFKTRCWEQDGETIEAMKLAIDHMSSKLLGNIGIGIAIPLLIISTD